MCATGVEVTSEFMQEGDGDCLDVVWGGGGLPGHMSAAAWRGKSRFFQDVQ